MKPIIEKDRVYSLVKVEELDHTNRKLRLWIIRRNKRPIQKIEVYVSTEKYHHCYSCPFTSDCRGWKRCEILEQISLIRQKVWGLYGLHRFTLNMIAKKSQKRSKKFTV